VVIRWPRGQCGGSCPKKQRLGASLAKTLQPFNVALDESLFLCVAPFLELLLATSRGLACQMSFESQDSCHGVMLCKLSSKTASVPNNPPVRR